MPEDNEEGLRRRWRQMLDAVQVAPAYVMARFELEYLPELIHAASIPREGKKTTSTKAARELCSAVAFCIEHGVRMPPALKEHILKGLQAGAADKSVDGALRLNHGAGQRNDPLDVVERERRVAVRMYGLTFREGLADARAKEIVCQEFGFDTRRVEQIWQRHRPSPEGLAGLRAWQADMRTLVARAPTGTGTPAYSAWLDEMFELSKCLL